MESIKNPLLTNSLGFAGLLPFFAAAWGVYANVPFGERSASFLFLSYSVVILSFLGGALWGKAKEIGESAVSRFLLIVSNILALTAWSAMLLGEAYLSAGLAVSLIGFISVYLVEHKTQAILRDDMGSAYLRFRLTLTTVVCLAHLLILAMIH